MKNFALLFFQSHLKTCENDYVSENNVWLLHKNLKFPAGINVCIDLILFCLFEIYFCYAGEFYQITM